MNELKKQVLDAIDRRFATTNGLELLYLNEIDIVGKRLGLDLKILNDIYSGKFQSVEKDSKESKVLNDFVFYEIARAHKMIAADVLSVIDSTTPLIEESKGLKDVDGVEKLFNVNTLKDFCALAMSLDEPDEKLSEEDAIEWLSSDDHFATYESRLADIACALDKLASYDKNSFWADDQMAEKSVYEALKNIFLNAKCPVDYATGVEILKWTQKNNIATVEKNFVLADSVIKKLVERGKKKGL